MSDTSKKNPKQNPETRSPQEQKKIDEILDQQKQLQTLYNQVVSYIQEHPNMGAEKMKKYQHQLKELSDYYQKNQEKLRIMGYSTLQVNKDVVIKKNAAQKISIKTILMGCAGILVFFLLGMSFLFYYLVQNPTEFTGLSSFGITPVVAKNLLTGVTLTLMMIIILLGVVIVIINSYKAFTVKNKSKIRNYGGIILGVIILGIAAGAGAGVLGQISNISVDELLNPNDVLLPYVQMRPGVSDALRKVDGKFPLIAPTNIAFSMITNNFQKFINIKLGQQRIDGVQLDCGNGQILASAKQNSSFFSNTCFYTQKGDYKIQLIVSYTNPQTLEKKVDTFEIRTLRVASELSFEGKIKSVIPGENEYVVGMVPSEITFNADQIFRDLKLSNYRISRDGNGDGGEDKFDDTNFSYTYDQAKVFYPTFSLPDVSGEMLYSFPLRIEKSLIPVCKIDLTQEKVNQYLIEGFFYDDAERFVADHSFSFIDKVSGKVFDVIQDKDTGLSFPYIFPGEGVYTVKMNFTTHEGQQSSCEVDTTLIGKAGFSFDFQLSQKKPSDQHFELLMLDSNKQDQPIEINLIEIPTKLKFKIDKIAPKTIHTTTKVLFDDTILVSNADEEYQFDIKDTADHTIRILIEDKNRGLSTEQEILIHVVLEDITGSLVVVGDAVGHEPLEVTLDASATKINTDFGDEIIYFSRDFGDGETKNNVTNGVITHKYIYDHSKDNGMYYPSVKVTTKK